MAPRKAKKQKLDGDSTASHALAKPEIATILTTTSIVGSVTFECSLPYGENLAEQDDKTAEFVQTIVLRSKKNFSVEIVGSMSTMLWYDEANGIKAHPADGRYAGRHILVLEPLSEDHFRFLDLPPEVRNIIYAHLLVRRGVKLHIDGGKPENVRGNWGGWPPPPSRKRKKSRCQPHADIFRVSRQVIEEASSVFYGFNRFIFYRFMGLHSFLQKIGPRATHLRDIEVVLYGDYAAESSFRLLAQAKDLEHLAIQVSLWRDQAKAVKWARQLRPLLRAWQLQGRDRTAIMDVLKGAYLHRDQLPKKREAEDFNATLKDTVTRALDAVVQALQTDKPKAAENEIVERALSGTVGRRQTKRVNYAEDDADDDY